MLMSMVFPDNSSSIESSETQVPSLGQEDPLEEEMATHSSILAGKIPWTEEPGRLQSTESQKSWTQLSMYAGRPLNVKKANSEF